MPGQFAKFLLVGALNTLVGYGFFVAFFTLGLPAPLALALAFILGVIFNFFSTGRLVFGNRQLQPIFGFVLVYLMLYAINLAALETLRGVGFGAVAGQGALVIPMALLSFFSLRAVFRTND